MCIIDTDFVYDNTKCKCVCECVCVCVGGGGGGEKYYLFCYFAEVAYSLLLYRTIGVGQHTEDIWERR